MNATSLSFNDQVSTRLYGEACRQLNHSLARLSSGSKSSGASSDILSLATSQRLSQEEVCLKASRSNLQNGGSFADAQDAYLDKIHKALVRMGELAIRATDACLNEPPTAPKRYELITGTFTWAQAKADAESRGGQLATIKNAADMDAVKQVLAGQAAWAGASDAETEGQWKWVDGTGAVYTNWHPTQPDNAWGGEDALQLRSDGTWNDLVDTYPLGAYVIEYAETNGSGSPFESEFDALVDFIDGMSSKTFNGVPLFDGNDRSIPVGLSMESLVQEGIDLADRTYASLLAPGGNGYFISGVEQARTKLAEIDQAMELLSEQRATVGSNAARLEIEKETVEISANNLAESLSRLRDVDVSEESTEMARHRLMADLSSSMIHQFPWIPRTLLQLLDSPLGGSDPS